MKTRQAFNANTQQLEDADVTIDQNGDYLFTFADFSFLKFPGDFDKKGINDALDAHQAENEGKVTLAALEKINEEKLANI
jgi:hypothetical protein